MSYPVGRVAELRVKDSSSARVDQRASTSPAPGRGSPSSRRARWTSSLTRCLVTPNLSAMATGPTEVEGKELGIRSAGDPKTLL